MFLPSYSLIYLAHMPVYFIYVMAPVDIFTSLFGEP